MGRINSAVLIESVMERKTNTPTRLPKLRSVLLFVGSKLMISSSTSCKSKLRHSKRVVFVDFSGVEQRLETRAAGRLRLSVMSDAELNESAKLPFLQHPLALSHANKSFHTCLLRILLEPVVSFPFSHI
jgi:hypothetical protein